MQTALDKTITKALTVMAKSYSTRLSPDEQVAAKAAGYVGDLIRAIGVSATLAALCEATAYAADLTTYEKSEVHEPMLRGLELVLHEATLRARLVEEV